MSQMKPEICVYISGQARNFNDCLDALNNAMKDFNATYFISVWRSRGIKVDGALTVWQFRRMFSENVVYSIPDSFFGKYFYEKIPSLREVLVKSHLLSGDVSEQEVLEKLPEAIIEIQDDDSFIPLTEETGNQEKMIYKMWRCGIMRKDFELRYGKKFDWVLRMRPDILIRDVRVPELSDDNNRSIWVAGTPNEDYVDDNFAFASTEVMDVWTDAPGFLKSIHDGDSSWISMHKEYAKIVKRENIVTKPTTVKFDFKSEPIGDEDFVQAIHDSAGSATDSVRIELESLLCSIKSRQYLYNENYQEAKNLANEAIRLKDESVAPYFVLGTIAQNSGDLANAISLFVQGLTKTNTPQAHVYIKEAARKIIKLDAELSIDADSMRLLGLGD